jgi:uncharacterized RDD family membrane protein YckC
MPLDVACPSCQTRYSLPEKFAGKKLKCKSCGKPFSATVGAAKAAGDRNAGAARRAEPDAKVLEQMGLGAIRKQPELFPAEPSRGPDPLRNHVVQDPGFGSAEGAVQIAGTASGLAADAAARDAMTIDDDEAAVIANPFASPRPVVEKTSASRKSGGGKSGGGKSKSIRPASSTKRFLGYFIDGCLFAGMNFAVGLVVGLIMLTGGDVSESTELFANIIATFGGLFATFLYYVFFEGVFRTSLGKLIVGTKVVDVDDGPASFGQVLIRSLCRFIPFEQFTFLFGADRHFPRGLHDRLSGTKVIDAR